MTETIKIEVGQVWEDRIGCRRTILELRPCDSVHCECNDDNCLTVIFAFDVPGEYMAHHTCRVAALRHTLNYFNARIVSNWKDILRGNQLYIGRNNVYRIVSVNDETVEYRIVTEHAWTMASHFAPIDVVLQWLTEERAILVA